MPLSAQGGPTLCREPALSRPQWAGHACFGALQWVHAYMRTGLQWVHPHFTLCFFSSPCIRFLFNDTLKLHTRLSNAISCVIPKNDLPSTMKGRIY